MAHSEMSLERKYCVGLSRAFSPGTINPQLQQAPLTSETMRRVPPDNPIVHFDLDPGNGVLVIVSSHLIVIFANFTAVFGDLGEDQNVPNAEVGLHKK